MKSSQFRVLLFLAISPAALADNALKENISARELVKLIADRMDLAEPVARNKWNSGVRGEDKRSDLANADAPLFKTAVLDAEAFSNAQIAAFKERQRQLFAEWKASGVDGFDDDEEDDVNVTVRAKLRENAEEEVKRLVKLKPLLCTKTVVAEMNETATVVLGERAAGNALIQPVLKSLETIARDDAAACETKKRSHEEK